MTTSDREALQELLKTVKPLASQGLKRPSGVGSGSSSLVSTLTERWSTKERLIERLLQENEPRQALDQFETRTREFTEKYPDRKGWTDKAGQEWGADLVLQSCEEIRDHLDSWDVNDDEFVDDDSDGDTY
ncbi:MAG: hypothetical protein U0822_06760 [Anaerolineae bacterium]